MTTEDLSLRQGCLRWSNRLLLLALLGIVYLTLFPFEFRFSSPHIFHGSPFFLGASAKTLRKMDFFLNVLLFVPFGFGLAAQVGKRGGRLRTSFVLSLILGACTTYLVELLQLYIPGRDSGWEDVVSNTTGSVVGFCAFALFGGAILRGMSQIADFWDARVSPRRIAVLVGVYFALWMGLTLPLQMKTRLSNWDPQCVLVAGNDAAGANPWNGKLSLLQIWNRTLSEQAIRALAGQSPANVESAGLLASYDFTSAPPVQDQRHDLPPFDWTPAQPPAAAAGAPELSDRAWLRTNLPAENLTREIRNTNQFTVHVICEPESIERANGRIVSLSESSDNINFHLRQEGSSVVLWFRNPMSETRSMLAWTVRGAFERGKVRDIVATYDGSNAFLYLDGKRVPRVYRLNPGAALVHHFFTIKTADLGGYVVLYETLIFLPAGVLIGWRADKWAGQRLYAASLLAFGIVLPAVLLEFLQIQVSGRRLWPGNIAWSVIFGVAGVIFMNLDQKHRENAPGASSNNVNKLEVSSSA